jgi:hypothetical protein
MQERLLLLNYIDNDIMKDQKIRKKYEKLCKKVSKNIAYIERCINQIIDSDL